MTSRFSPPPTAEQVILAIEAVSIKSGIADVSFVADFADLTSDQAEAALLISIDLGMVSHNSNLVYSTCNPLCRFLATSNQGQKATVLRILLESYEPFITFRNRLAATGSVSDAARQTKSILSMVEHHQDISTSLLSLGTFSQAVRTSGGGHYEIAESVGNNSLAEIAEGCKDIARCEALIVNQLGQEISNRISRESVLAPLADAMRRANSGDGRGAVVQAGNAIESYLIDLSVHFGIALSGTGINAKLDELKRTNINLMPTKLLNVGKYLGHIRNAADHGVDSDIGTH